MKTFRITLSSAYMENLEGKSSALPQFLTFACPPPPPRHPLTTAAQEERGRQGWGGGGQSKGTWDLGRNPVCVWGHVLHRAGVCELQSGSLFPGQTAV